MLSTNLPLLPGEGEERVYRILESITDGFFTFDAEWRFGYLNAAAKQIVAPHIGDPGKLLGQDLWEAIPGLKGTIVEEHYRRAVEENMAIEFQYLHQPWQRWYSVRAYPIRGGGLSVYFRDITKERNAAEALRLSEEKYRTLFSSLDQAFTAVEIIRDENGRAVDYRFIEVNHAFEAQTGLRDAAGKTARELVPDLESRWVEVYSEVALTGVAARFTDYSPVMGRWFEVYAFPFAYTAERNLVAIIFTDVTARQQSHQEMVRLTTESRERVAELEALLDVLPIGIGIASDSECRTIRVNPSFARTLGLQPHANASKTAPAGDRPSNFRVLDDSGREIPGEELPMQSAAREGRIIRDLEMLIAHEDGRRIRLLEYAAPLFDERGEPRGSVGAFIDITERRADEDRNRFMLRLEDAVRPLSDPTIIVAEAARFLGEYLDVDRCAYADVEADEDTFNITGDYTRGVHSIVGRYTFAQFGSEVLQMMRAGQPYVVTDSETHQPAPQDLEIYRATLIRAVICVPLHKEGRFVAAMAVHQKSARQWTPQEVALVLHVANRCWEAIERVRVSRVLEESERRFRALADNIAQLAWMGDAEGTLFWYNQRWFDFTGATLEEMYGWGWKRVHHPDHIDRVVEKWQRHLREGLEWEDTFPLLGADGKYRWFLSRAVPIRDEQGRVTRWFGTNTDITEQRESADALSLAKDEAERANRAKDDFLAVLSHELRTPLTPVLLAAASLLEMEELPEDVRADLLMVQRNVELEARLIDDLIDLTRIARGKIALHMQPCEVHALLRYALETVQNEAASKGITVELALLAVNSSFHGDPVRIQQVFSNLLRNAVKFTPGGGQITVRSANDDKGLIIEVIDNGVGIESEALERIFLPFEQAGYANDHRFGGLGLGLSISRAVVDLHGGLLRAESAGPARGATFRVHLPLLKPALSTKVS